MMPAEGPETGSGMLVRKMMKPGLSHRRGPLSAWRVPWNQSLVVWMPEWAR